MSKILSIIIPTRNRQKYCLESALSILKELDETCELIIQDNSSNNSLKDAFEKLDNKIIKYNYNSKPLSFIDNFEEAVLLSTAKYFCILGDDDSITGDMLPLVKWMDANDIDSLASTSVIDYIWPNDEIPKYKNGLLKLPIYAGGKVFVDARAKLIELLKKGILGYQSYQLPRTYHGIIKKSCIDDVKKLAGRYFGGLTPDIYSTVTLACVVKKHCIIDYPFSIAGACPESATVKATVGGHSGKLSDAPHLTNRGVYSWEKIIPQYYSVETIWAETAIKAIKDVGFVDLLKYFDNYRFYVISIYLNKQYIYKLSVSETLKLHKQLQVSSIQHLFKIAIECVRTAGKMAGKKLFEKKINNVIDLTFENVKSLDEAKIIISENLKKVDI